MVEQMLIFFFLEWSNSGEKLVGFQILLQQNMVKLILLGMVQFSKKNKQVGAQTLRPKAYPAIGIFWALPVFPSIFLQVYCNYFTSFFLAPLSSPPASLSLPPTIDARTLLNVSGREATGTQAVAPGSSVSTEEIGVDPSFPPATTSAWEKGELGWSHPSGRKSSTSVSSSFLGQFWELLNKTVDIVPATLYDWTQG